jgi:hypothetical protein
MNFRNPTMHVPLNSQGYWLNPDTEEVHLVGRHQDWILEHAAELELNEKVRGLDADRDEDLIRILGCQAGLVRLRNYRDRVSVQFWTNDPDRERKILQLVYAQVQKLGVGPYKPIWINNLADQCSVNLYGREFAARIDSGAEVLSRPAAE